MPIKIEHPVSPGDVAFTLHENKVERVRVGAFRAHVRYREPQHGGLLTNITFFVKPMDAPPDARLEREVPEKDLFPTKEALIASL